MDFVYRDVSLQQTHEGSYVQQTTSNTTMFFATNGPEIASDARSDSGSQRGKGSSGNRRNSGSRPPPSPVSAGLGEYNSPYGRAPRPLQIRPKATFSVGAPYNKKLAKKLFPGVVVPSEQTASPSRAWALNAAPPALVGSIEHHQQHQQHLSMMGAEQTYPGSGLGPQPSPRLLPQMAMLPSSMQCEEQLCDMFASANC